ncbi:MAG: hypothetical protein E1N59_2573 [Puniceicoccaceae bacterium 5H]|nr:MAG: hypothetical protein E1N59_2573 [Puniceicoccaceae bacterium 5H]
MTDAPRPPRRDTTHAIPASKRWLLYVIAFVTDLWMRSLRFRMDAESQRVFRETPAPAIFVLWHNRCLINQEIYRRFRKPHGHRLCGLVSRSKDGAWLAALFELWGTRPVRGSTKRGGTEAVRELVRVIRDEKLDTGITVDGPRGPLYHVHQGAALLAVLTRAPIVHTGIRYHQFFRLPTWDKFFVPLPFSKVTLTMRAVEDTTTAWGRKREDVAAGMEQALKDASQGTDPEFGI